MRVVCLLLFSTGVLAFASELVLKKGEVKLLAIPDFAKEVDLSSAKIVRVEKGETKRELYLTALNSGQVKMAVQTLDGQRLSYQITVTKPQSKGVLSPSGLLREINDQLLKSGIGTIKAKRAYRRLVLVGTAANSKQASLALRIAKMIAPKIENGISANFTGGPSILVNVKFIEVIKDNGLEYGFDNQYGPSDQPAIAAAHIDQRLGNKRKGPWNVNWRLGGLGAMLKLIHTHAVTKIASEPSMLVRSGHEAEFHAGRTFFLKRTQLTAAGAAENLIPVDTGIILKIKAEIDAAEQINTIIAAEVSDFAEQSEGRAPIISKSKVNTALTITEGEAILISGLKRLRRKKQVSRIPLLADIPLVGELFKNRKFSKEEVDMLILVTLRKNLGRDQKARFEDLEDRSEEDVEFKFFD